MTQFVPNRTRTEVPFYYMSLTYTTSPEPKTIYKCPKHKYSIDRTGYCKICGLQLILDVPPYKDKWAEQRVIWTKRKVKRLPSPNDPTFLMPTPKMREPDEIRAGKFLIKDGDRVIIDLADTDKTRKYLESRGLEFGKGYIVDFKASRSGTVRIVDSEGNFYVGISQRYLAPLNKRFEQLDADDAYKAGSILDI